MPARAVMDLVSDPAKLEAALKRAQAAMGQTQAQMAAVQKASATMLTPPTGAMGAGRAAAAAEAAAVSESGGFLGGGQGALGLGRGSAASMGLRMLTGGGQIFAIGLAARLLENMSTQALKFQEALYDSTKSSGDLVLDFLKMIPLLGDVAQAGRNFYDVFTGAAREKFVQKTIEDFDKLGQNIALTAAIAQATDYGAAKMKLAADAAKALAEVEKETLARLAALSDRPRLRTREQITASGDPQWEATQARELAAYQKWWDEEKAIGEAATKDRENIRAIEAAGEEKLRAGVRADIAAKEDEIAKLTMTTAAYQDYIRAKREAGRAAVELSAAEQSHGAIVDYELEFLQFYAAREKEATAERDKATAAIERQRDALIDLLAAGREKAETAGMTPRELAMRAVAKAGGGWISVAEADMQGRLAEQRAAAETDVAKIKAAHEAAKTKQEKYEEQLIELSRLSPNLSSEDVNRLAKKYREEYLGKPQEARSMPFENPAAAYERIAAAAAGRIPGGADPVKDTANNTAAMVKEVLGAGDNLKEIRDILKRRGFVTVLAPG